MKSNVVSLLISAHCFLICGAVGQVPELVNYQGRLLDDGVPVNSTVQISTCIYSNETGGVSLYTEDIGNVAVVNGLYSFSFGAGGSVVKQSTELIAVTDGTSLSFSTTVANPPMRIGSVSVGVVGYSWDEVSGSSNPSEFTVTVNHATGLVNVFYLLGPPDAGSGQGVTYEYTVAADFGTALANPEAWLEVKINDEPLTPRQRLISVPYARKSKTTEAMGSVLAETEIPKAGAIRWNGSSFEGYNGIAWVALSGSILLAPEMVTVGDPGNPDDPEDNGFSSADKNSGAVAYTYKIGKYEVTNAEYTKFLNAVDPSGVNNLNLHNNNSFIIHVPSGAIGSKYVPLDRLESTAVVLVSLYDAMRYCNWLHNGAVQGGDTESGAYTLLGDVINPTNGLTVSRNAGAKFAVPTEDEWYKAAYYEPGGDSDDYWLYPTGGNSPPAAAFPPGVAPSASFNNVLNFAGGVGKYTTTIGHYGTFDMAGNVQEWIESFDGAERIRRGGSWSDFSGQLASSFKGGIVPTHESALLGFRIVSP